MNIHVQAFMFYVGFLSYIPRNGIAVWYGNSMFELFVKLPMFSKLATLC